MVKYVCHVVLIPFQWKLVLSYNYTRDHFVLRTVLCDIKRCNLIDCFKVI
jgi:hypothetical protein